MVTTHFVLKTKTFISHKINILYKTKDGTPVFECLYMIKNIVKTHSIINTLRPNTVPDSSHRITTIFLQAEVILQLRTRGDKVTSPFV